MAKVTLLPDPKITAAIAKYEGTDAPQPGAAAPAVIPAQPLPPPVDPVVEQLVGVSFSLAAMMFGPHWALKPAEQQQFAAALDPVLDKYLPDLEMGPEVGLIITAGVIVAPRVVITRQNNLKAKQDGNEPTTGPTEQSQPVPGGKRVREKHGATDKPGAGKETKAADPVGPGQQPDGSLEGFGIGDESLGDVSLTAGAGE